MKKTAFVLASIIILFVSSSITFAAEINGVIAIIIGSGDVKYGAKVNVLLTTKEISVIPVTKDPSQEYDYKKAILLSLGDAWEKVDSEIKNNASYIVSKTTTNLSGKFNFANVKPGKYYVVVTWPSTIARHKVFWQVPVDVKSKDIDVELSNDNFTVPPYFD